MPERASTAPWARAGGADAPARSGGPSPSFAPLDGARRPSTGPSAVGVPLDLCAALASGASLDALLTDALLFDAPAEAGEGRPDAPAAPAPAVSAPGEDRAGASHLTPGPSAAAPSAPAVGAGERRAPAPPPGPLVRVCDDQTIATEGEDGPHLVCPYWVEVVEDHAGVDGHLLLCRVVRPDGPPIPLRLAAEALGDGRKIKSALAAAMGVAFRPPLGSMDRCVAAWMSASRPRTTRATAAFGFTPDGATFVDAGRCLPAGELRFMAPPGSPAARLGLRSGAAVDTARRLLTVWPEVLGCPATVTALLGLVGWALVAPVLEARDPSVSPLIMMLSGPTGAGKSTHAGVAQCFFGDFAHARAAVPFSSTPLAIEAAAQRFAGALMVVGDVKATAISPKNRGAVTSLLQRAGDRGTRQRLDATGAQGISSQSRATLLLEGEDLPTTEGSSVARMLLLTMPTAPRAPGALSALVGLLDDLSGVTEALVRHLIAAQPWSALLETYRGLVAALSDGAAQANAARVARSVAAVRVGAEVWQGWLRAHGLALPVDGDTLEGLLLRTADDQLDELRAASPAARLLTRLRELIDAGRAHLQGGGEPSGVRVGRYATDGTVQIFRNVAVNLLNQNAGPDEPTLTVRAAGSALHAAGALLERTGEHFGNRIRHEQGLQYVWQVPAAALWGAEREQAEAAGPAFDESAPA